MWVDVKIFFRANIIFTAKIIARFVNDIGTAKVVIECLHFMANIQELFLQRGSTH